MLRFVSPPRLISIPSVILFVFVLLSQSADAVIWRDDLSDAEVRELAAQGQFAGVGTVTGGGTGVAIAPGWVLTARHVVDNGRAVTFRINGVNYAGTSVSQEGSDLALVRLNPNQQLPASTTFISPNPGHPVVNRLVWKVGFGQSGSVFDTQQTPRVLGASGVAVRAGTNIINSTPDIGANVGPSIVFNQSNTNANSTVYEVSTAPGDSGGPTFLQHNNQWFVAGATFGAIGGVGFVESNVAARYDWIVSQTGDIFAPQAAPTELFWDGRFDLPGVQNGAGSWHTQRPNFTSVGGSTEGFNYTWDNDRPATAVFGTPTTNATVLTVDSDITFSEIRFAPNLSTGPFQVNAGAGSLSTQASGSTVDAQVFARIGASITGTGDLTKVGAGDLLINGDNSTFAGEIIIGQGTAIFDNGASFGVGGFTASTKTVVQDGGTLQLRGPGVTSDEHLHITGSGVDGKGAIFASFGNHLLTERIALQGDATINLNAGTSVTFGGDQGRFYNANVLTQTGDGTAVYDNVNNIAGLAVVNGIVAGDGGINGSVTLTTSAELRPGDSANVAAIGSFGTGDLTIDDSSLLTIDLDPTLGTSDVVNVAGSLQLAGMLQLNLLSMPMLGQSFLILNNDGADSVSGMFASGGGVTGLFGGEMFRFAIDYGAGTGNDVSITAVPEPGAVAGGILVTLAVFLIRRRRNGLAKTHPPGLV